MWITLPLDIVLTQQIINNLFDIYKEITGSLEKRYPKLENIVNAIISTGTFEYRAGSKWSGDSKFYISNREIWFYHNCIINKKQEKEINKAEILFEQKVKNYFNSPKKQ